MEDMTLNLQLFAVQPVQTTLLNAEGNDLSAENKTHYHKTLLDNAQAELVHDQFAEKFPIPRNGGKTIEFRRFSSFPLPEKPLTEGVTPNGEKLNVENVIATVGQWGSYTVLSDMLDLVAIDPVLQETVELHGEQAGKKLDHITRDVMLSGTNVRYAGGVTQRTDVASDNVLTVDEIIMAVATLRTQNAPKIDGHYVGIVHPNVSADLRLTEGWIDIQKYQNPEKIYEGEIGTIGGVRFVESSEAKIYGGAGAAGASVYCTTIVGAKAYGTVDIEGGGLEYIIKPRGSGDDPLNQRSTAGWKAIKTAVILDDSRMVRIEHGSKTGPQAATN